MSSPTFGVTLRPDRRLIGRIGLAAAAALGSGFVIVLHLPLPAAWRILLAAIWLAAQLRECALFLRAAGRVSRLRLDAAGIHGLFENGMWRELALRPGTVVTERFAWLRLSDRNGRACCVALSADAVGASAWRRLRLWYRLRRQPAAFGRPGA